MEQGDAASRCFTSTQTHAHKQLHTHADGAAEWVGGGESAQGDQRYDARWRGGRLHREAGGEGAMELTVGGCD